jgi:ABC-type multidrug transport system fused ATPase/permease subunit
MESVHALIPDMTVIMSAHRLNIVRGCDKIFVLDDGCIVQEGTHAELMNTAGLYKNMWDSQNK